MIYSFLYGIYAKILRHFKRDIKLVAIKTVQIFLKDAKLECKEHGITDIDGIFAVIEIKASEYINSIKWGEEHSNIDDEVKGC